MRLTFDRGGGGCAGVPVAGIFLLLPYEAAPTGCGCSALQVVVPAAITALSLAPQPAASRFRECCRYGMRLENSREGFEWV